MAPILALGAKSTDESNTPATYVLPVTAVSIEQYPNTYDAALPVCGALGDVELFDYFLDFGVAAQQLGTGSSQFPVDPARYISVTVPTIRGNLEAVPGGWPIILNADGAHLKQLTELRSGGDRPNFDEAWSRSDPVSSRRRRSSTAKVGRALFHECAPTFLVIRAVEAGVDHLVQLRHVAIGRIALELVDRGLAGAHGQRRVG